MEIIIRASVVFVFLLLLTRGMKRRALADMAPFELLLLVMLGDIVQQGITQEDYSLTGAILAASTISFWVSMLTYLSWRSRRLGRIIDGTPTVIVVDGKPVDATLKLERLPIDEVLEAARQAGISTLQEVRLGVLEPSGKISFIRYD